MQRKPYVRCETNKGYGILGTLNIGKIYLVSLVSQHGLHLDHVKRGYDWLLRERRVYGGT